MRPASVSLISPTPAAEKQGGGKAMRRIVVLIVASGSLACAGAPVVPSVDSGTVPPASGAVARARPLPNEPKAQWHVEPNAAGVALELRF